VWDLRGADALQDLSDRSCRDAPPVAGLIDAAMTMLTSLARAYGSDPIEGVDAHALRLASLVNRALATVS
jgi:citrate lyase beta subunit